MKKDIDFNSADVCLRLVKVNMDTGKLKFTKGKTGKENCGDGTPSEISGNPNICGDKLTEFEGYFPDGAGVEIRADSDTCSEFYLG